MSDWQAGDRYYNLYLKAIVMINDKDDRRNFDSFTVIDWLGGDESSPYYCVAEKSKLVPINKLIKILYGLNDE